MTRRMTRGARIAQVQVNKLLAASQDAAAPVVENVGTWHEHFPRTWLCGCAPTTNGQPGTVGSCAACGFIRPKSPAAPREPAIAAPTGEEPDFDAPLADDEYWAVEGHAPRWPIVSEKEARLAVKRGYPVHRVRLSLAPSAPQEPRGEPGEGMVERAAAAMYEANGGDVMMMRIEGREAFHFSIEKKA